MKYVQEWYEAAVPVRMETREVGHRDLAYRPNMSKTWTGMKGRPEVEAFEYLKTSM